MNPNSLLLRLRENISTSSAGRWGQLGYGRALAPVLAVRGTESDTLFPDAWMLWQTLQPSAAFVEMEGLGHMLAAEDPEGAAAVVGHWLEDVGVAKA